MMGLPAVVEEAKKSGTSVFMLTDAETDEVFFFKRPGRPELNRFMSQAAKQKVGQAVEELVNTTLLHPSAGELAGMVKEQPGLKYALNNALQTELGINRDFIVKKL